MDHHPRVICIEENVIESFPKSFKYHYNGAGKVYYKNLTIDSLHTFPAIPSSRPFFFRDGQHLPVLPDDYRTDIVARIQDLNIHEKGRSITVDDASTNFNIYTRNDPMDNRVSYKGSYKHIKGKNYYVNLGSNFIPTEDSVVVREYNGYKSIRYAREYKEMEGYYYIKTPKPEKVEGIIQVNTKLFLKLYLIKKLMIKKTIYGVYRDYSQVMAKDYVEETMKVSQQEEEELYLEWGVVKEKKDDRDFGSWDDYG